MIKKIFVVLFCLSIIRCAQSQSNSHTLLLPGIYSLEKYLPMLGGKNIAVVANKASNIGNGNLIDTLLKLSELQTNRFCIKSVFSPEHGFSGKYEAGAKVENEKHLFDSIRFVSLYGKKFKPEKADLKKVDVMVFDLQDVGVRFYTYLSTLHYVMQACAENNIPLIVLDRPNPNAFYIDGPVMEEKYKSFVGLHPVPVVYGMTIGEYAQMINGEGWLGKGLKCKLTVIPISNYTHKSRYNLPDRPSPNLPNMLSIYLYPSLCFFEGTVVSVGRGTDFPFQAIGHPDFTQKDFSFIPRSIDGVSKNPPFEGEKCFGIDLRKVPIDSLLSARQINLKYLLEMYANLSKRESFFNDYFDMLAGTDNLRKDILYGKTEDEIRKGWNTDIERFKKIRAKYILYPD